MTENEINIADMIKALRCIASQDAEGDCYCDHFNAHLTCEQFGDNTRIDEKHMSCGGVLKDTQSCPYSQKTYGVCFEDGELWWLKDIASMLAEIQQYRTIGTIEEFKALKEKNEPKKAKWHPNPCAEDNRIPICPNCNTIMVRTEIFGRTIDEHCVSCGQAIDWSEWREQI